MRRSPTTAHFLEDGMRLARYGVLRLPAAVPGVPEAPVRWDCSAGGGGIP